ncbi:amidohydrolase [Sphingomonas mesophila]|uniref:amidohydrolase n=1 Tax=Sphingomonas mesophila TaxID=2303576 RepID=UPI000E56C85C|nr:amidohydrolase [Sphingomonas mesophila]
MRTPALLIAAAIFAVPTAAKADTLIVNVNGIQADGKGGLDRFTGLLVGDDGRVKRVLRDGDAQPKADRVLDRKGMTMLPGLIDAHGHVMGLGLAALQLDLTGTSSLDDFKARIGAYAKTNPGGGWITGRGWNQELWPDKRMPTAADIDAVVSDRPVWLERVDGHASVGNSMAMRLAGIGAASKSPAGGKIERDPTGRATGLFIDSAAGLVSSKVPPVTPGQRDRALVEAQRMMLRHGLTAVADMGTSVAEWAAMRRAAARGKLFVRVMSYAAGVEPLGALPRPSGWLHGDRLWFGGVKLYADGALGSRGAWLKRPYADAPTTGLKFHSDAQLLAMARRACSAGFQLAIHAIGDAANDQVIGTYEHLRPTCPRSSRWRIEHAQVVDPADIPRIARAGLIASMQPTHQTSDRTMAEARLDEPRLKGAYAWSTIARSGARLAFGSDFPVEHPNPFPGLAAAVSRQDPKGAPPGGWRPEERVPLGLALAGFTRGAAYAGFAEQRIGSLEPGKWADFIFVDQDIASADPVALAATKVIETWVAGDKVYAWREGSPGLSDNR